MGSLADIYVRVLADDSPAQRTIRKFRISLNKLGQEEAKPKVELDTIVASKELTAMRLRLKALDKTIINVPIHVGRVSDEIKQVERELDKLTNGDRDIEVELGSDLDKQIKVLQAHLKTLERRKVLIPIDLEASQTEFAKVYAAMKKLESEEIKIHADIVGMKAEAAEVERIKASLEETIRIPVNFETKKPGARNVLRAMGVPALAAAAGAALGSIAALAGGLTAFTSAAAPAAGGAAALSGGFLALAQGGVVAGIAMNGVGDAFKAVNAINASTAAGFEPTEAQIKKVATTYGLAGEAAQGFVKQLLKSSKAMGDARKAIQGEAFPGFTSSLKRLTNGLLPAFTAGAKYTARVLGMLADDAAKMMTAGPFKADFKTLMDGNTGILYTFGKAAISLLKAFVGLQVAALPLTQRFANFTAKAGEAADKAVLAGRASGKLAQFFELAGDTASQLGRILKNIAGGLFNVGKASFASGQSLLSSFESATGKFRELSGAVSGQNKLKAYFENAATVTRAIGKLFNEIALSLGRLGSDTSLGPLIDMLRVQLLPVLEAIISNATGASGKALVDMFVSLGGAIERITASGGLLNAFAGTMGLIADALSAMLDSPLGPLVDGLLQIAGVGLALGLVGSSLSGIAYGLKLIFNWRNVGFIYSAGMYAWAGAVWAVSNAHKVWTGIQWALNAALWASPITWIIGGLVLLGIALFIAWKKSETFRDIVKGAWEKIKQAAGAALDWFTETLPRVWTRVKDATVNAFNAVKDKIASTWNSVKEKTSQMWEAIWGVIERPLKVIRGLFTLYVGIWQEIIKKAWAAIKWVVKKYIDGVKLYISTALKVIKFVWEKAWNAVKAFLTPIWNAIKNKVMAVFNAVKNFIQKELNETKAMWERIWGAVKNFLTPIWNAIRDKVMAVFNKVKEFLTERLNNIKRNWSEAWEAIRTKVGTVWDKIKTRIQGAMDKIKEGFNNTKDAIGRIWDQVLEKVKAPVIAVLKFINDPIIPAINSVTDKFVQNGDLHIEQLKFAHGGAVRGPGGPTDDLISAKLSNGEFVISAAAVQKYGTQTFHELNERRYARGGLVTDPDGPQGGPDILGKIRAIAEHTNVLAFGADKLGLTDKAIEAAQKGLENLANFVLEPLKGQIRDRTEGQGMFPQVIGSAAIQALDGIISMGKDKDKAAAAAMASGASFGGPAYTGPITFPLPAGSYGLSAGYPYYSDGSYHDGQDFTASSGTPVFAPFAGFANQVSLGNRSYGNYVDLRAGNMRFIGAHLSAFGSGGMVAAGQTIGYVGTTGNSSGNHLHARFDIGGNTVDPRSVLRYDSGGDLKHGSLGMNTSGKTEAVLTHDERAAYKAVAAALVKGGAGRGGSPLNIEVNVAPRDRRVGYEVADAIENRVFLHGWVG